MPATAHRFRIHCFQDKDAASRFAAELIGRDMLDTLDRRRAATAVRPPVYEFGTATGETPKRPYRHLIEWAQQHGLDLKEVQCWGLDERIGAAYADSYWAFMEEYFWNPAGTPAGEGKEHRGSYRHLPSEDNPAGYDEQIRNTVYGGIDLWLLGIGRNGHIGFNEPGSPRNSVTRIVTLAETTVADAAGDFGGLDKVPPTAVTAGVSTIIDRSAKIVLLAFGPNKRDAVRKMVHGPVTAECPASFLQEHRDCTIIGDHEALADVA